MVADLQHHEAVTSCSNSTRHNYVQAALAVTDHPSLNSSNRGVHMLQGHRWRRRGDRLLLVLFTSLALIAWFFVLNSQKRHGESSLNSESAETEPPHSWILADEVVSPELTHRFSANTQHSSIPSTEWMACYGLDLQGNGRVQVQGRDCEKVLKQRECLHPPKLPDNTILTTEWLHASTRKGPTSICNSSVGSLECIGINGPQGFQKPMQACIASNLLLDLSQITAVQLTTQEYSQLHAAVSEFPRVSTADGAFQVSLIEVFFSASITQHQGRDTCCMTAATTVNWLSLRTFWHVPQSLETLVVYRTPILEGFDPGLSPFLWPIS